MCLHLFSKTDDGVPRNCVWQRWRAMLLHLPFCGTTCFFLNCQCGVWKNVTLCDPNRCRNIEKNFSLHCKMRYWTPHLLMVISWDHMNRQRFQQSRLVTPYNNHEKKMRNTLAKSNDFSSWCFRPIFCPSKWTKIVNVKTCTKSNLSRKRVFQWCSRYMF